MARSELTKARMKAGAKISAARLEDIFRVERTRRASGPAIRRASTTGTRDELAALRSDVAQGVTPNQRASIMHSRKLEMLPVTSTAKKTVADAGGVEQDTIDKIAKASERLRMEPLRVRERTQVITSAEKQRDTAQHRAETERIVAESGVLQSKAKAESDLEKAELLYQAAMNERQVYDRALDTRIKMSATPSGVKSVLEVDPAEATVHEYNLTRRMQSALLEKQADLLGQAKTQARILDSQPTPEARARAGAALGRIYAEQEANDANLKNINRQIKMIEKSSADQVEGDEAENKRASQADPSFDAGEVEPTDTPPTPAPAKGGKRQASKIIGGDGRPIYTVEGKQYDEEGRPVFSGGTPAEVLPSYSRGGRR